MSNTKDVSPLPLLLLMLSMTTGLVDAASVLGLGAVFTANMTGNIVFLGFALVGTPGFVVDSYLAALAMFFTGALLAGRVGASLGSGSLRGWLISAAVIEGGLLGSGAVIASWFNPAAQSPPWALYAIIAATALAMGFRNATIRQLKVPDLTTTVLTMTITGLAADSTLAGGRNPNWGRRIASIAAILAGAALGAFLVTHTGSLVMPLALAAVMVVIGTGLCALHPSLIDHDRR